MNEQPFIMEGGDCMYRRILAPVDGADMSNEVLEQATRLAMLQEDSVVMVLHVAEMVHDLPVAAPVPVGSALVGSAVDIEQRTVREAEEVLSQATELLQRTGIRHEARLRYGNAASEICTNAEVEDSDVIVIGRKDKSAIERFLLGSVSRAVVDNAPCNVLVVNHR